MSIKKYSLVAVFALAMSVTTAANAQLGALGGLAGFGKKPAAESSGGMSIGDWIKLAQEAEALVRTSSEKIYDAVGNAEKAQQFKEQLKAASEIKDDKERAAAVRKVEADRLAALQEVDFKAKAEQLSKEQDAKKVKNIGAAVYNFILGVLKDKELAETSGAVISSASSNPMALKDVGKVKDFAASIVGQMTGMTKVMTALPQLAKVAKVEVPKDSKAKAVESSDI